MANSTLRNAELKIHGAAMSDAETASMGTASETMATAGFTIPSNCHQILLYADADYRHHNVTDPTTSFGILVESGEPFVMQHNDFATREFITTGGGDATFIAVYIR